MSGIVGKEFGNREIVMGQDAAGNDLTIEVEGLAGYMARKETAKLALALRQRDAQVLREAAHEWSEDPEDDDEYSVNRWLSARADLIEAGMPHTGVDILNRLHPEREAFLREYAPSLAAPRDMAIPA